MRQILIEKFTTPFCVIENAFEGLAYEWRNSIGDLHRDNGLPATYLVDKSGKQRNLNWYKNGLFHRTYDLPACIIHEEIYSNFLERWLKNEPQFPIYSIEKKMWFFNGKPWREKGKPTSEFSDGTKTWRNEKGEIHRVGGPAVILKDGTMKWYRKGDLYRGGDKPAVIHATGALDFVDKYGVVMHVNMAHAMIHYGEQIKKDRERNGIFSTYIM